MTFFQDMFFDHYRQLHKIESEGGISGKIQYTPELQIDRTYFSIVRSTWVRDDLFNISRNVLPEPSRRIVMFGQTGGHDSNNSLRH